MLRFKLRKIQRRLCSVNRKTCALSALGESLAKAPPTLSPFLILDTGRKSRDWKRCMLFLFIQTAFSLVVYPDKDHPLKKGKLEDWKFSLITYFSFSSSLPQLHPEPLKFSTKTATKMWLFWPKFGEREGERRGSKGGIVLHFCVEGECGCCRHAHIALVVSLL